ncbi:MAG TPA: cupin [Patescibacteria group bacterium]|nr:cupin [Patescibacteria group bacterium]
MYTAKPYVKKILKPWGFELKYTTEDAPYCGKIMHVSAGGRWSVHYHEEKKETLCLVSGEAEIWLHDGVEIQKFMMESEVGYYITPGQTHRVIAITDCILIEASEPEHGLTIRVEDDNNRPNEDDALRKDQNRGWYT